MFKIVVFLDWFLFLIYSPFILFITRNDPNHTPRHINKLLSIFLTPTQLKHTLNNLNSNKNQDLKTTIFYVQK